MDNVSDGLKVDFTQLSELGNYLKNADFDSDFEKLNKEMSQITTSWFDLEGEQFKNVFESFVKDAKKISDCVDSLGEFSTNMSKEYEASLVDYTAKMKEVLDNVSGI